MYKGQKKSHSEYILCHIYLLGKCSSRTKLVQWFTINQYLRETSLKLCVGLLEILLSPQ